MIISKLTIGQIQGLLEKGHTVELRVEEGDPQPKEGGGTFPGPLRVTVAKRPDSEHDIPIPPTLLDQDGPTMLTLTAKKAGSDPVMLRTVEVPAGFYVAGIKGYLAISQEIPKESMRFD